MVLRLLGNLSFKTLRKIIRIKDYLLKHKFIYLSVLICNLGCFNFHYIFKQRTDVGIFLYITIVLFFLLSFLLPIVLGLLFTARCFVPKNRNHMLVDIIHSYVGIIFVFSALYFQSMVIGDFLDAKNKKELYEKQLSWKKANPQTTILPIAPQRAFTGIRERLWSGYDYPDKHFVDKSGKPIAEQAIFWNHQIEKVPLQQVLTFAQYNSQNDEVINYQSQNVAQVYLDCLYFSLICIATVGFGDLAPTMWYTKIFTTLEVFIGISIFVFAIGMLFSNWKPDDFNLFGVDEKK